VLWYSSVKNITYSFSVEQISKISNHNKNWLYDHSSRIHLYLYFSLGQESILKLVHLYQLGLYSGEELAHKQNACEVKPEGTYQDDVHSELWSSEPI